MNDQWQLLKTTGPAISTTHQFLADHIPATVKDSFQMVNVLNLLTIYQLLKSAPQKKLSNPWDLDRVRQVATLLAQWSLEHLSAGRPKYFNLYNSVPSHWTCNHLQHLIEECLINLHKFCNDWKKEIFAKHFGSNNMILRRMVQNLSSAKLCAVSVEHPVDIT